MKIEKILLLILVGFMWSCTKPTNDDPKNEIVDQINSQINSIIFDKDNTQWVAADNGLYKKVTEGYEQVLTEKVNVLYYEKNIEMLWIGAESNLLKADLSVHNFVEQEIGNGNLSHPTTHNIFIDSSQRRWFGAEIGFSLNKETSWKKENFRINVQNNLFAMDIEEYRINSIASWDGDYFFGTAGARLYRAFGYNESVDAFSGATQWVPPYNGSSITDTIFVVFIDKDGKQWFGGKNGIQVHTGHEPKDMGSFTYYYDELPDNYVLTINQAPDGRMWIGTRKGIAVFDGTNWQTITNGLPDLYVTTIAFDMEGSVWVGTKTGTVNL